MAIQATSSSSGRHALGIQLKALVCLEGVSAETISRAFGDL
ncbi:unnamed protein product [Prunus brigantina]